MALWCNVMRSGGPGFGEGRRQMWRKPVSYIHYTLIFITIVILPMFILSQNSKLSRKTKFSLKVKICFFLIDQNLADMINVKIPH